MSDDILNEVWPVADAPQIRQQDELRVVPGFNSRNSLWMLIGIAIYVAGKPFQNGNHVFASTLSVVAIAVSVLFAALVLRDLRLGRESAR